MLRTTHGRIVPVAAVMLVFGATALQAQEPELPAPEPQECQIQVEPEVAIDAEPIVVQAAYSEAIGETLRAMLEEESGVEVVTIEEGTEPLTLFLTLDTRNAEEGEWSIALEGEAGECKGTFVVARDDPSDS